MSTRKDEPKGNELTGKDRNPGGVESLQFKDEIYGVNRSIEQTKENVRRSIEEARREIPAYAQSVSNYQQQAIDSTQEMTDNYLDSQREIINSMGNTWDNYIETVYWWLSPRKLAELYTQAVSNFADNAVSGTRIWNKTVLANMDASKAYLERSRESVRDIARMNSNAARMFERTGNTAYESRSQQRSSQTR